MPLLTTGAGRFPAIGGGGPFTPLSLTNLYAWYKADAGVFSDAGVTPATNGQDITAAGQWNDQSGVSGINLVSNTEGLIVFNAAQLNSLPTVDINASALSGVMDLSGTSISVWAVVQVEDTTFGRVAGYGVGGSDTGSTGFIGAYYPSLTEARAHQNGDKSTHAVSSGAWHTIASVYDSGTGNNTLYINNDAGTPVSYSATFASSGQFTIFNAANFGNPLAGRIAELIVCKNYAFNSTDRSNLAGYSSSPTRWGI